MQIMTTEEIIEASTEQEEKKKPARYEYFTIVWYFLERPKLLEDAEIYNLGYWQASPAHERQNIAFFQDEITRKIGQAPKKPHIHLICKSANKMTANAFIKKLCDVLQNDITGVAIAKEEIGVANISLMLRYQLHLNNPYKEHFDIDNFIEECPSYFWKEYSKAFQTEIQYMVQRYIETTETVETRDILNIYKENLVITEWINDRKHLQLVHNLLDDNRKRIKEQKNNEYYKRFNKEH